MRHPRPATLGGDGYHCQVVETGYRSTPGKPVDRWVSHRTMASTKCLPAASSSAAGIRSLVKARMYAVWLSPRTLPSAATKWNPADDYQGDDGDTRTSMTPVTDRAMASASRRCRSVTGPAILTTPPLTSTCQLTPSARTRPVTS
jgi:hypothetical protein